MKHVGYIVIEVIFRKCCLMQEQRKWNTKLANGMRSVSVAVFARQPLVRRASSHVSRKFIVQDATKRNSLQDVLNAIR